MANDVNRGIENALDVIVTTTGSSGNMKKELKTTIFDTVSILRNYLLIYHTLTKAMLGK